LPRLGVSLADDRTTAVPVSMIHQDNFTITVTITATSITAHNFFTIDPTFLGRFLSFLYQWKQEKILYNIVI